jgi:flagellar biosynthesis protein FlhF
MNIKKYIASTAQEAVQMVKREMGPEAVILRTRTLYPSKEDSERNGCSIEVTAAIDYEASAELSPGKDQIDLKAIAERYRRMEAELRELKEAVLSADAGTMLRPEVYYNKALRTCYMNLKNFGLRPEIISELMSEWRANGGNGENSAAGVLQDSLLRVLSRIPIHGNQTDMRGKRIISFVGPTGVGKTTTLAKLAALSAIKQGRKAALITVDTFRVAAVAQLETYARIMGIPLEVAVSSTDLQKAIRKHSECDSILIDTAGRSPNQEEAILEMKKLFSIPEEIHCYLVLSATTRYKNLLYADQQFGALPFSSYIFTKLDETEDASSMINFLISRKKPVSYFATGQQVPEDIEVASRKKVASLVLARMRKAAENPAHGVSNYGSG